ncbi:hypothetical protein BLA34_12690 [Ralstonia solanacearum]|nr:hypothetical protein BLA34_12690 [Ralstonia solanacearum]
MVDQQYLWLAAKFLGAAISPKVIGDFFARSKEKSRSKNVEQSRLDQLSSFFAFDVLKRSRLVVEQQFKTIFGTLYDYDEILCILSGRSPLRALMLMRTVRHLVEFDHSLRKFNFRKAYSTEQQRTSKRRFYYVAYAVSVYAIFGTWYLAAQPSMSWLAVTLLIVPTLIFGSLAWVSLDMSTDFQVAERFITAVEPPSSVNVASDKESQTGSSTVPNISVVR